MKFFILLILCMIILNSLTYISYQRNEAPCHNLYNIKTLLRIKPIETNPSFNQIMVSSFAHLNLISFVLTKGIKRTTLPLTINYELWTNFKPNLNHLSIFGCPIYFHIPNEKQKKLDIRSSKVPSASLSTTENQPVSKDINYTTLLLIES